MFDLSRATDALRRFENEAACVLVQRWMELTHDATHPAWRARSTISSTIQDGRLDLVHAVDSGDCQTVLRLAPHASSYLMSKGYSRRWQHNAVKTRLLNARPIGDHLEPFCSRLSTLLGLTQLPEPTDATSIRVTWELQPTLTASAQLPWKRPRLPLDGGYITIGESKTDANGRRWHLQSDIVGDYPMRLERLGARMRRDGTTAIDLLRLSFPSQSLQAQATMRVEGSSRLTYLKGSAFPRTRSSRRSSAALGGLLDRLNRAPASETVQRLAAAAQWTSTATLRWNETPVFATGILWIALEALFGKCVARHHSQCARSHPTAVDLYMGSLAESLAADLEDYLLTVRGTPKEWANGRRNPPNWMRDWISRGNTATELWLRNLLKRMEPERHDDPLLFYRCREILDIEGNGTMRAEIRRQCAQDLSRLKQIRNALVHEGNVIAQEEESDYLAALACEIVFCSFEHPEWTFG